MIRTLEKWPKGWGVMGDDVLAGILQQYCFTTINVF
jgi:phosphatidylglycerophosphatase A